MYQDKRVGQRIQVRWVLLGILKESDICNHYMRNIAIIEDVEMLDRNLLAIARDAMSDQ